MPILITGQTFGYGASSLIYTRIPPLNNIRFIEANTELTAAYHYKQFDRGWYREMIRPWETDIDYVQKIQNSDKQFIQLSTTGTSATMYIIDSLGNIAETVIDYDQMVVPGNVYEDSSGNDYQLITFQFQLSFGNYSLPDGVYYVVIEVEFGATSKQFVSEPLWIKDDHEDTAYIEYTNNTNDYDVIFENPPMTPTFGLRVEADIEYIPVSNDVVFEDENFEVNKLSSTPYRNFNLTIGDSKGVPAYMIDKVNRILSCDVIKYENFLYKKELNEKMTITDAPNYPLKSAIIKLRDFDHDAGYSYVDGQQLLLWTSPGTYPYAIDACAMQKWPINVFIVSGTIIFSSSADEDALITAQNSAISAPTSGLLGSFQKVGNNIVYNNDPTENWQLFQPVNVYNKLLSATLTWQNSGTWSYTYQHSGGSHVADWGNGVNAYSGASGLTSSTHTYPGLTSTSSATLRIFHSDAIPIGEIHFFDNNPNIKITNISGVLPSYLQVFQMAYQNFSALASLDSSFLFPCQNTLKQLFIIYSGVKAFSPRIFNGKHFNLLKGIMLSGNALPVSELDYLFNDFYSAGVPPSGIIQVGGLFATKPQNPVTVPSATSASARDALQSIYGWTILI